MSFYQRMMRLQQAKQQIVPHVFTEQSQEDQGQLQEVSIIAGLPSFNPNAQEYSQKQYIEERKTQLNMCFDQVWQDIPLETSVQMPRVLPQPKLMNHKISRKDDMLRSMLDKKRQFQLKLLKSQKKSVQLPKKLQQSVHRSRQSVRQISINSQIKQSVCRIKPDIQQSKFQRKQAHNGAEQLNRQVMMRLLSLLQNQRNQRMEMSMKMCANTKNQYDSSYKPRAQKQCPIVINNILKSPMQFINKDLIQRQMNLRLMEQNRMLLKNTKKYQKESSSKKSIKLSNVKVVQDSRLVQNINKNQQIIQRPLTHRQRPSNMTLDLSSNMKKPSKMFQQEQLQSFQVVQASDKKAVRKMTMNLYEKEKGNFDGQQTKSNSCHQSQVTAVIRDSVPTRQRQFKNPKKHNKNKQQKTLKQQAKNETDNKKHQQVKQQQYRPPVRIQIPLENDFSNQNITLAQAFKRKIGRLKSERAKDGLKTVSPKKNIKNTQKNSQMQSQAGLSQISIDIKPAHKFIAMKSSTLERQSIKTDEFMTTPSDFVNRKRQTRSRGQKSARGQQSKANPKKIRSPPKQVMDRLIYGQKVQISKKQMYALTKKNYQNLPQVLAKKREQQKKKQQAERLAKARQYQRSIRCGKSSKKNDLF